MQNLKKLLAIGLMAIGLSGCVTRPYVYTKGIGAVLETTNTAQIAAIVQITENASHADAAQANRPVIAGDPYYGNTTYTTSPYFPQTRGAGRGTNIQLGGHTCNQFCRH